MSNALFELSQYNESELLNKKQSNKSPKKKINRKPYAWSKPFLNDDGRVWIHVGYGEWVLKSKEDRQAQVFLKFYNQDPRRIDVDADRLRHYLMEHKDANQTV